MSVKQVCETLFSFDSNIKASEVVDFLEKQGVTISEHSARAYKAHVTMKSR